MRQPSAQTERTSSSGEPGADNGVRDAIRLVLLEVQEQVRRLIREEVRALVENRTPVPAKDGPRSEDRMFSTAEVAAFLGVATKTVRSWILSGRLRAERPGHQYRIRESDLKKFCASVARVAEPVDAAVLADEILHGRRQRHRGGAR